MSVELSEKSRRLAAAAPTLTSSPIDGSEMSSRPCSADMSMASDGVSSIVGRALGMDVRPRLGVGGITIAPS